MRRSIELTGLGHRRFYRAQNGFQHRLRLKFDAIPVSKARYEKLSAPAQKAIVQAINRSVEPMPFVRPPLARQERELEKVIKLIALFEPFILHNDHVFEAANVERLSAALPPEERAEFRLRCALARLVGLLDQRPHSGAAQVVLSSDRGPSTGGTPAAKRAAGGAQRSQRRRGSRRFLSYGALTPEHRGHPSDRVHRLHRCPHRVESAGGSFRAAEPAGARARCTRSARPSVASPCSCTWIFRSFETHLNSRIHIFLRRSDRFAISALPTTSTASSFAPPIP